MSTVVRKLQLVLRDKPLVGGLVGLLAGQLLLLLGFGGLYVLALVYVLTVGLPYPAIVRSWFSRAVVGLLLALSVLQLAATVQFFVLPQSNFSALSLITTVLVVACIAIVRMQKSNTDKLPSFNRTDAGALVTAAFFVVPFLLLCFWGNDPARLTSFGGLQSPDGSAHSAGLDEMATNQHLTYHTNPTYYPKGFHIAQAFVMENVHLQRDVLSWEVNARVFVLQFAVWGGLLACILYYFARQLAGFLFKRLKPSGELLLSVLLGAATSVFYLFPFAQEGFLNFYYICTVFVCGLLFVEGFKLRDRSDAWLVLSYFLLGFGITMSWGPLVLPMLVATPALYILAGSKKIADIRKLLTKRYWPVWAGFLLLLIPLYIHFSFSDETSFIAQGSIRVFNVGLLLAGIGLLAYIGISRLETAFKDLTINVLLPAILLVCGLAAVQYLVAGEPRYYTIKTSYLFEMIIIAVFGVLLVHIALTSKLDSFRRWLLVPVVFGSAIFLLVSISGNPLHSIKAMLNRPTFINNDVQKVTRLGVEGELRGSNATILHYNVAEKKLFGNSLIINWATSMTPKSDSSEAAGKCTSTLYTTLNYGIGDPAEQPKIISALKTCVDLRQQQGQPYYIITDPASVPHLKQIIGSSAIFL